MLHWLNTPPFQNNELFQRILKTDRANRERGDVILPPRTIMLRAFSVTPLWDLKVVLLGQDPYPTPGAATGLAFSVHPELNPLPKSLQNIFKELKDDVGVDAPNGDLLPWARKGVLLLNTALTIEAGAPGSHEKLWKDWTLAVVKYINDTKKVPFLLWGRKAQTVADAAGVAKDHRVESAHPSPLSAHDGFFGSRPFSRLNSVLKSRHESEIDWSLVLPPLPQKEAPGVVPSRSAD